MIAALYVAPNGSYINVPGVAREIARQWGPLFGARSDLFAEAAE